MSKEAITNKILTDAKLRADAMLGEAKLKAGDILSSVDFQCKAYIADAKENAASVVKNIQVRSKTVAELDAKKLLLKAKSQIIDNTFALALEKVKSLDKADYKKLIINMLKWADDGDTLTISKREKDIITDKDIEEFSRKSGKRITLSKVLGNFDGGIILSNHGIDKNLTLEVEFSVLRDEMETVIAGELFS